MKFDPSLKKSILAIALVGALYHGRLHASGSFAPPRWLEEGGIASERSPEFYWKEEVTRIAQDFHPPEKRSTLSLEEADQADFNEALQSGAIQPDNKEKALSQHRTARLALLSPVAESLPEEFNSEFALYHKGAHAFQKGSEHYEAARTAWETLLNLPVQERHYRSVWASYMLGKLALKTNSEEAAQWFQKTRSLAAQGFVDSLGLAADSYGWEGRAELDLKHYEKAAELYLNQLALGDLTAIDSLKLVVPNLPDDASTLDEASKKELQSPLLLQLATLQILSQTSGWYSSDLAACNRILNCLKTLESLNLAAVKDAEYIGWIAYNAGKFEESARWLKLANPDSPVSLWLKAKLARRAGNTAEAARLLSNVFDTMRTAGMTDRRYDLARDESSYAMAQYAAGDLAGIRLERAEFVSAMDVFLRGNLWRDAAFLADWVLTVDELKTYVDKNGFVPVPPAPDNEQQNSLPWLLARRLVRENRYQEAREYFSEKEKAMLDRYVETLKNAADSKKPKLDRARHYFTAAWIVRYFGMELMGTEMEPDGFYSGGDFDPGTLGIERQGKPVLTRRWDQANVVEEFKPQKLYIRATPEEKRRLAKHQPEPNKRFHYRYVATGLA
ncbi:MAG: hypothetical protein WCO60_19125 [Verrucomicrobiota bacterium]